MERLTHKAKHEAGYKANRGVLIWECVDKLGQLEDMEEKGRLVKLPCKEVYESVGDSLYYIFDNQVIECVNCGVRMSPEDGALLISLSCGEKIFPYTNYDENGPFTDYTEGTEVFVDDWGKVIFYDKQQAEQALKQEQS